MTEAGNRVGQSIACRRQGRRCERRRRISRRTRVGLPTRDQRGERWSQALWLGIATIPPGNRTKAHVHEHHETAFYMMSGDGLEMWTGDQLQHRDVVRPGDYLYIPANVLHVAVNRASKPAVFLGARNEPTAQESVVMHPEMDAKVP